MTRYCTARGLLGILAGLLLGAAASADIAADIRAALDSPRRPPEQRAQDELRKPAEVLEFAQIKRGQIIADFMSGNGYFTRLLSEIVGARGHVYAFLPSQQVAHCDPAEIQGTQLIEHDSRYTNVSVLTADAMQFKPPKKLDVVWLALDYHDLHDKFMQPVDVATLNRAFFQALKPGGELIVIDHLAPPGTGLADTEILHRIDPGTVRSELEAAGFKFADSSDVLRNPSDDHTRPVFDAAIRGRTDQFVFKFVKPRRDPS